MAGDRARPATAAVSVALAEKFGLMSYLAGNLLLSAWAAAAGRAIARSGAAVEPKSATPSFSARCRNLSGSQAKC